MTIVQHDLDGHEVADFLEDHLRQMRAISPPESKHALDLEALRADDVTFWVVLDDREVIIGTGALKLLGPREAEIKSMRTAPNRTRGGVASKLLVHILEHARSTGIRRVSLETGSAPFFEPARRLYAKHGFTPCKPFGGYHEDPHSVFFTRTL